MILSVVLFVFCAYFSDCISSVFKLVIFISHFSLFSFDLCLSHFYAVFPFVVKSQFCGSQSAAVWSGLC